MMIERNNRIADRLADDPAESSTLAKVVDERGRTIKIGDRVRFNYGAGIPEDRGTIAEIKKVFGYTHPRARNSSAYFAIIDVDVGGPFDSGTLVDNTKAEEVNLFNLRDEGELSANGSGIGIYLERTYGIPVALCVYPCGDYWEVVERLADGTEINDLCELHGTKAEAVEAARRLFGEAPMIRELVVGNRDGAERVIRKREIS